MSEIKDSYTLEQAICMPKAERLAALLHYNSMTEPLVYGQLRKDTGLTTFTHWIKNLRSNDTHKPLRAPVSSKGKSVVLEVPVKLSVADGFQDGDDVALKIDVVPDNDRQLKSGRPFAVSCVGKIKRLKSILDDMVVMDGDKILVPESVWNYEKNNYEKAHKGEIDKLENDLSQANFEIQHKHKELALLNEDISKAVENNINLETNRNAIIDFLQILEEKKEH